jgi:hypothetical protein
LPGVPDPQPSTLDYAPPLPWYRRSRARRLVWVAVAMLTLLLVIRAAPRAWNHVAMLYWQGQCMDYVAPADQVVYDQLATPGVTAGPPTTAIVPASWRSFYMRASPSVPVGSSVCSATAFLHRRTDSSSGADRLVAVDVFPHIRSQGSLIYLACRVFTPGTALRRPREEGLRMRDQVLDDLLVDFSTRIRVFAGQPDPADASHFTIVMELDGEPRTLDGWLLDDDTIKLERRK